MKYSILLFLLLTSCSNKFSLHKTTLKDTDLPNECEGLVDLINNNWKKKDKSNLYKINNVNSQGFIIDNLQMKYLINNPCITQLDTIQIKQLFGKPNERGYDSFRYYFNKKCLEPFDYLQNDCRYLLVTFNNKGQVSYIGESSIEVIND